MIKVNSLSKSIENRLILDNISISVKKGSIYGVIGVNGAGKTTLIRHMIGAYIPDSGDVTFDGQPVLENNAIKKHIVYIPDEFPTTLGNNIAEIAKFYRKIYPTWSEARYQELIAQFKQNELAHFTQFSKGMKKQVMFILALSIMPDYLIMDEPFDGLDPLIQKKIWQILVTDVTEREMTIFISSHHLKELDVMCEKICLLNQGKVVFEYAIDELKSKIHKIQLAFHSDLMKEKAKTNLRILNESITGKILTWIVEGELDEIMAQIEMNHPLIIEALPMDLEEIFTYALGGEAYALDEIFTA